jgi:SulP family sulfate permease
MAFMNDSAKRSPVFHPKLFTTIHGYDRASLFADLQSGLTVALVALPLAMAIAIASGANPGVGLVTAVVAGFLISALGGSRFQIGGPTGAFIVVVYSVIQKHGFDGLVTATFMAGLILIAAAYLRAGALMRHIPEAVINGFTAGIAIIIAASQLADVFGLKTTALPADLVPKIEALWAARDTFNLQAFLIAAATVVLIVFLRRRYPKFPGLLVAVAATSAAAAVLGLPVDTIGSRFGGIPSTLPVPSLPDLSLSHLRELLPSALVIAFLAGVESLLSAIVADRMGSGAHRANPELLAQGLANCASALVGGLPATGAIARTATNIKAGGRTPVAGMAHAVFLLLFMLVAAPLAGYLAMPALGAVLLLTAWNMAELDHLLRRMLGRRSDAVIMVMTLLLTAFVDLTVAIGVGVAAGLAVRLRRRNVPEADWETPDR